MAIIVSDLWKNGLIGPKNHFEKKFKKTKQKIKKLKTWEHNKSKTNIMDILSHILPNQRQHCQSSFRKHYLMFSILRPKFSRNRYKVCRKFCNAKIYPLDVWISDFFFKLNFRLVFYFFVFHFKLWKTYRPCIFFKDKFRLYVFESLKWKTKW